MTQTTTVSRSQLVKIIKASGGTFFSATTKSRLAMKRNAGKPPEDRVSEYITMNVRLGVRKYNTGGIQSYNPEQHDLLTVCKPRKGYRSLNLTDLTSAKIRGKVYEVIDR